MPLDHRPTTVSAWALRAGLALTGMDAEQLWVALVGVGGNLSHEHLVRALDGSVAVSDEQHDIVALALNDALLDDGLHFPVAYAGELER